MALSFYFREIYRSYYEKKWIDAGGNPAVRHEGVAPSNNLIKDATHRATVFVGPTLKSFLSLLFFAKFTGPIMRGRGRGFKSRKAEGFLAQLGERYLFYFWQLP